MNFEKIIIIRDKTRMEQLIERFNSKEQARFYLERNGENFSTYQSEHTVFYQALEQLKAKVQRKLKYTILDRSFLPTFIFDPTHLIIVIGQDGLVANTAKYVGNQPIIGVNPNPAQYDGVLLPFQISEIEKAVDQVFHDKYLTRNVTMAQANTQDGLELLAFNDLYIGASSHVSSRYQITFKGQSERQSSSGILVSTGAGSTGWLSSVFNMTRSVETYFNSNSFKEIPSMEWEEESLMFVVREPFLSKSSQIGVGMGKIESHESLLIESHMPLNGVVFSDGIESDFIPFNTGARIEISVSKRKAYLVA